jgi:uncharacterized protein YjbI with pentapeptide repeats
VGVIADHLRDHEYSWSACDFDFRTAHLEDVDFAGATFRGTARFDLAMFSGPATFGGATFSGDVWFGGATFSDLAWFGEATFSGDSIRSPMRVSSASARGCAALSPPSATAWRRTRIIA